MLVGVNLVFALMRERYFEMRPETLNLENTVWDGVLEVQKNRVLDGVSDRESPRPRLLTCDP